MDIAAYISTGIIEEYCLGLLSDTEAAAVEQLARQYPDINTEVERSLQALSQYNARTPRAALRPAMVQVFEQLAAEKVIDLANPPLINRHSNAAAWKTAVEGLAPQTTEDGIDYYFFDTGEDVQLCIAWLNDTLREEAHQEEDFAECFLILEGSCECDLGGVKVSLTAGDYLDIPFGVRHTIRNTSVAPQLYVKAMVQRRRIA